jgi:hypothetical protein
MFKSAVRKVAFALFSLFLVSPVERAFASNTSLTSAPSTSSTTAPSPTPTGITGTDPEPIEPYVVSLILTFLSLA